MAKAGQKEKRSMAWGWIIFWFILFWPLGALFLFRKLSADKAAVLKDGKKVTVVSFILMGLGAFIFLAALDGSTYTFFWAVALVGGGIWAFVLARRMKVDGERYKKYIAMIVNQSQTSVDNIASAVGVSYEIAVKDLQKMIDAGYFAGAYIDASQREIVLAKNAPPQVSAGPSAVQVQERVVTCGSCGANNKVTGHTGECEYCGSYLQ
ncbi:MAG: hypothetical protein LBH95_05795 [Oscillospiraceae bacterium]|jgi:hypothetical protein|nr:hypothetical protein [Oscillospiraceae bacterium]